MDGDASPPSGDVTQDGPPGPVAVPPSRPDARRLPPSQLAKLLVRSGAVVATEERVLADISAGAPVNDDGTIGIVSYAAWLAQEDARGGR